MTNHPPVPPSHGTPQSKKSVRPRTVGIAATQTESPRSTPLIHVGETAVNGSRDVRRSWLFLLESGHESSNTG